MLFFQHIAIALDLVEGQKGVIPNAQAPSSPVEIRHVVTC